MALGLPIVSTNVGGIPFLINHEIDGLLVEKNNEQQMYKAIVSIINDVNSSLAANARKKVEKFDWEFVKNKWLKILN